MRLTLAALATALSLPAFAAGTPPDAKTLMGGEPMRFAIVRSAEPGCEPSCAEWISAEGKLLPGSAADFERVLRQAGKRRLPVLLSSPGGSVEAAMAIGKTIRQRGLDVAVARTKIEGCIAEDTHGCKTRPPGVLRGMPVSLRAVCASACTLVFAAGVNRFAAPWSGLGVHQITTVLTRTRVLRVFRVTRRVSPTLGVTVDRTLIKETRGATTTEVTTSSAAVDKRLHAFLRTMTGTDALVPLMDATPASAIHWMTRAEQLDTKLTSQPVGGEVLALSAATRGSATVSDGTTASVAPIVWRFAKNERDSTPRLEGKARFETLKLTATLAIMANTDPKAPAAHRLLVEIKVDPNPQRPGEPDPASPFARAINVGVTTLAERALEGALRDPLFPSQASDWLSPQRLAATLVGLRSGARVHALLVGGAVRAGTLSFETSGSTSAVAEAVAAWGAGPPMPPGAQVTYPIKDLRSDVKRQ